MQYSRLSSSATTNSNSLNEVNCDVMTIKALASNKPDTLLFYMECQIPPPYK